MGRFSSWMNNAATDFEGFSRWLPHLFRQGVADDGIGNSWRVTQRGTGANMSVDISAGDGAPLWYDGGAWSWSTGVENVTIAAASANNRRDLIIAYTDLSVTNPSISTPNNPGALKFTVVKGIPATSPIDPGDVAIQSVIGFDNPVTILARISLTSSTTQITNAQITDLRKYMALNVQRLWGGANSTRGHLVPNHADGTIITSTDTASVTPGMISKFPMFLTPKQGAGQSIPVGTAIARTGLTWTFTAPFTGYADCLAGLWGRPNSAVTTDNFAYWLKGGATAPDVLQGGMRGITPGDNPGLVHTPYGVFSIIAGVSYTLAVYLNCSVTTSYSSGSQDWGKIILYPSEYLMAA